VARPPQANAVTTIQLARPTRLRDIPVIVRGLPHENGEVER
jgi:hypothetical protein